MALLVSAKPYGLTKGKNACSGRSFQQSSNSFAPIASFPHQRCSVTNRSHRPRSQQCPRFSRNPRPLGPLRRLSPLRPLCPLRLFRLPLLRPLCAYLPCIRHAALGKPYPKNVFALKGPHPVSPLTRKPGIKSFAGSDGALCCSSVNLNPSGQNRTLPK